MDARPQRPLRALHVQGDENIAPTLKNNLHQRHKSTGQLTAATMLNTGVVGAAKRTAFGDVSNTMKSINANQDNSTVGKPAPFDVSQKLGQILEKPAAFLRPAQRPLTAGALKAPTSAASTVAAGVAVKAASTDFQAAGQFGKARANLKRQTTVYKDASADSSDQVPTSLDQQAQVTAAAVAPVHQTLGPRQHKSQPQLKIREPVLRRTQSRISGPLPEEHLEVVASSKAFEVPVPEKHAKIDATGATDLKDAVVEAHDHHDEKVADQIEEELVRMGRELPALPPVSEPEEFWDDEEDEEIYDDQGYTTAHSYRSRGDNTTGGATTVLIPKVTSKVKRELALAKEFVEANRTEEEIYDEAGDTSMVAEYGEEIFQYMRELEMKMLPNPHYMDNQAEIQWSMRSVLMDWLIQVHHRFALLPETLFLCVNYIDRFLSCKTVSLGRLQLVGATAIFVAAKYEEINCPSVAEIVYMVDGGYTTDEILKAERFMLSMLQFELGWPGPMSFLRRISKADDYDLETRTLAKYFLEVTIMDERFVGSPPSFIAAGAHCLSRMMLHKGDWTQSHVYYSEYTWAQLRPLVAMIVECCENPTKHHSAVYDKYTDRRYKRASLFVKGEMDKGFVLPPIQPTFIHHHLSIMDTVGSPLSYETSKRMVQIRG